MKLLFFGLLLSVMSLPIYQSVSSNSQDEREKLIEAIVKNETEFAEARCFCRIGKDIGPQVNDYPNSYKDFGTVFTYRGINPVNQANDDDCGRKCSNAALTWANSQSLNNLCNYFKDSGPQRLVAYSKVGGKKWSIRQSVKNINCCYSKGSLSCPPGTNSENKNFPGFCSQYYCDVPGDRRLYNQDGSAWGFIWQGRLHKLIKGKLSGAGWTNCN